MEYLVYIIVPVFVLFVFDLIRRLYLLWLRSRKDTKHQIRAESLKPHMEEDHNRHLLKSTDSITLWKSRIDDCGIQMKIEYRMKENIHDEKRENK